MSSSSMRYCKEYMPYRASTHELGELRYVTITTPKTWERYGIHALEGMYPILGPGFISARNTGTIDRNVVHFKHERGADVVVIARKDMYGGFGMLLLFRVLVGLGDQEGVTEVDVVWPGGLRERWSQLSSDRYHTLVKGTGAAVANDGN